MQTQTTPEIMRVNLTSTMLTLKSLGILNVMDFDYLDKPNTLQIEKSLKQLYLNGAIDNDGRLTSLGREEVNFPLEPSFTKALLYAYVLGNKLRKHTKSSKYEKDFVVEDMLALMAILSTENIWSAVSQHDHQGQEALREVKKRYRDEESDHFGLVKVFQDWGAEKVRSRPQELNSWCRKMFLQGRALQMAHSIK